MTRTYYIGDLGTVRRLDNLTGSWVSVPLTTIGYSGTLSDVKTDPNSSDIVVVVGGGNILGLYGIYTSIDAGVTWTIPTGNYQVAYNAGITWNKITYIDANNIYVIGTRGVVVKSTDGGLTFNKTTSYPTPTGSPGALSTDSLGIHFTTPLKGVASFESSIFKTIDGGVTWTYLNGGLPITAPKAITLFKDVHITSDETTIVALGPEAIYISADYGSTFQMVYDFTNNEGIHLTWFGSSIMWATGFKKTRIQSIDGGATWSILSAYDSTSPLNDIAAHFYDAVSGFFSETFNVYYSGDAGTTGTLSDVAPVAVQAIWTRFQPTTCYTIYKCSDRTQTLNVGDDLSAYIGKVLRLSDGQCWFVLGFGKCITPVSIIISAVYDDCDICLNPPPVYDPCYTLTDCKGVEDDITNITTDLSAYVGLIIQIDGYTNACWTVTAGEGCNCTKAVTITGAYAICEVCPPTPVTTVTIPFIQPGSNITACDPEKVIKANKAFAKAWYDQMLSDRYGINVCCGYDTDKAFIAKEVIRLQLIYNPDACTPVPTPDPCEIICVPPVSVITRLTIP